MANMRPIDRRRSELSPAQRALLERRLRGRGADSGDGAVPRRPSGILPPLSFAQERLWFLDQLSPGDTTYNCIDTLPLDFAVDPVLLQRSLNEIVRRHESLRTTFRADRGVPVQSIAGELHVPLPVIDLRHLPRAQRDEEAHRLAADEAEWQFDLAAGPLIRTTLVRTGDVRYLFVLTMHHIVGDGWSMGVFWKELTAIWEAFEQGQPSPLPELPIQYADFAVWQRRTVSGEFLDRHLRYWRERLEGLPTLDLPTDRRRPAVQTFRGHKHPLVLPSALTAALVELGKREQATLFMTLLAAFEVLLHRYTEQEDFGVGTYLAGRNRVELESLIGFFINTLVMRADLAANPTFRQVLGRVRETALSAYSYQEMPFALLVQELRPKRDPGRNPLFQVVFHLFNAPTWDTRDFSASTQWHDVSPEAAVFDLVLTLVETPSGLAGALEYNVDLFDGPTIARMAEHFRHLLEQVTANPDLPIADIPLLGREERDRVLHEWNATGRQTCEDAGIISLFDAQVQRTPDVVALVCGDRQCTFSQLNVEVNRVSTHLARSGMSGSFVGVLQSRGIEAVVSLLAIFRAGAIYVPLDLSYPRDRLATMVKEANVAVVLTRRDSLPPPDLGVPIVCVEAIDDVDDPCLASPAGLDDIAYVIFTSGSTGRPKGIAVPHRQVLNRLGWMWNAHPFAPDEVSCHKTALSFVDSLWEILGPLLRGVPSVIVPDAVLKDVETFVDVMAHGHVTRVWLVPTLLRELLDNVRDLSTRLPALKFWVATGEPLTPELVHRFRGELPGRALYNLYGTSEVWDATWYDTNACEPADLDSAVTVPIGRAIDNVQAYILDRNLAPVPIGIWGELCIGGAALARGYLNDPEMTAARFVSDGLTGRADARLYRTGDVARFRADGTIECAGRRDHQVKLRGHRIELGEIEAVLAEHPAVRDVTVVLREDQPGVLRLVAYLVASAHEVAADPANGGLAEAVPEWQEVWDETYRQPRVEGDRTFDISGFNSSYSGLPIPAAEVREWVDQAVDRVLALKPQTALEIGCGTGLMLFRIAPACASYRAVDFSAVAVERLQRQLSEAGTKHVEVLQRQADDLAHVVAGSVDVVIINSVVQYFPNVDYLIRVLEAAARVVKDGGAIFVGDVRSLPLLEAFHASVELYRASDDVPFSRIRDRVAQRMAADEELVIAPAFFRAFGEHLGGFADVEIRPKRGRHHNEFSSFRYDVLLHKRPRAIAPSLIQLDWDDDRLDLQSLSLLLEREQPEAVLVSRVPNMRVTPHAAALTFLRSADASTTVRDLRHYIRRMAGTDGIDPEVLWGLANDGRYAVELYWSGPGADDRCDALFRRTDWSVVPALPAQAGDSEGPRAWTEYVNNPLHGGATRLVPEIARFSRARLPEYMTPAAFVTLERLPTTPSGKVDRSALPAPDQRRPGLSERYVSPRTTIEEQLTTMFAGTLGVDHVGVNDDFFADLQGHSLLATRLVSRIREAFAVDLPLRAVFETPTVAALAVLIGELERAAPSARQPAIERLSRNEYSRSGR